MEGSQFGDLPSMSMEETAAVDPRLCACGSGLRSIRCCGQDVTLKAMPSAARHVAPLAEQAIAAFNEGRIADATALCLDVLELAPGQAQALKLLYQIRRAGNVPAAAEALIRRVVALYPNDFWATNELTLLLLGKGALAEA